MAGTFQKRERETKERERAQAKAARREERKVEKANRPAAEDGVDPDLADILSGKVKPHMEGDEFP